MNSTTFTLDLGELNTAGILAESLMQDAENLVRREHDLQGELVTVETAARSAEAAQARLEDAQEEAVAAMRHAIESFGSAHHDLLYSIGERDFTAGIENSDAADYYARYNDAIKDLQAQVDERVAVLKAQARAQAKLYEDSLSRADSIRSELASIVITEADKVLAAGAIAKLKAENEEAKAKQRALYNKAVAMAGETYKRVCSAVNQMSGGAEPTSELWIFLYSETAGDFSIDWKQKEKLAAMWLAEVYDQDEPVMLRAVRDAKDEFRAGKRPQRQERDEPAEDIDPDSKPDADDFGMFNFTGGVTWASNVARHEAFNDILEELLKLHQKRADIVVESMSRNTLDQPTGCRLLIGTDRYMFKLAGIDERGQYALLTDEIEGVISRL